MKFAVPDTGIGMTAEQQAKLFRGIHSGRFAHCAALRRHWLGARHQPPARAPAKDITMIQTRLIELGYLGGSADGI